MRIDVASANLRVVYLALFSTVQGLLSKVTSDLNTGETLEPLTMALRVSAVFY